MDEAVVNALRDARDATKKLRAETAAQIEKLKGQLDSLDTELRGLELALARREGTAAISPNGWKRLTRTGAIVRVLTLAGQPMSPNEITKALNSTDRTDDRYPLVSAGIAYLKRTGVVQQAGYGQWELTPDHRPVEMSGPEDEEEASDSE